MADSSKGTIFYLHGNGGALDTWGEVAACYTDLGYDVFMIDYPGYGKSTGSIKTEEELFKAVQAAYDTAKKLYGEENIIVLGYSIGTGPASWLAANNHPKKLILQAPFYSLTEMMKNSYPVFPTFLLRYKFNTNEYLKKCKMPIYLFHGSDDEIIPYTSSVKLKQDIPTIDTLITLQGQSHNGITDNSQYEEAIKKIVK